MAPVWSLLVIICLATLNAQAQPLEGTQPLPGEQTDWAWEMVQGIDRFLLDETAASVERRARHWQRDFSSHEAYNASVAANRQRLAKIIGAVDPRAAPVEMQLQATVERSALLAESDEFQVFVVRWPAFANVEGEGLLLEPRQGPVLANIIALPDAAHSPELLIGLAEGIEPQAQLARRLAAAGCRVLVPLLIDRSRDFSLVEAGRRSGLPHREFIYRQAFEVGRHLIGYEVQKVLAAVDWFATGARDEQAKENIPTGIVGHGEGGLIALYAAALDTRIDAACVSGYFGSRQNLWQEPIDRNVFRLLDEFGDAELASLVAPRTLIIEASLAAELPGRELIKERHTEPTPGAIATPGLESVQQEVERSRQVVAGLQPPATIMLVSSGDDGRGAPGSDEALRSLLAALGSNTELATSSGSLAPGDCHTDSAARMRRQVDQLTEFTQHLVDESPFVRAAFWAKANRDSVDTWQQTIEPYREYFYNEVIGRFEQPLLPPNVRTAQIYDEPKFTGYRVVMDVLPNVIASGILLVPKNIPPGERRPVVVCQHGLEGRPDDLAEPGSDHRAYHAFACKLAEEGFITYSPQNPYIFADYFRTLQRKANPLGKTLFSIIVPQHQQSVNWLASLPMVDGERIAFYGLSYGGKTAMRVPPLVDGYCLSICSGDFNEWIWKNTSVRDRYSYMPRGEYEIFEFDLASTFNYAEMAALIAPRPFMVERGHRDGVAPDEWVAYEFAKVRLLYTDLGIADLAEIEYFDGPHTIHGVGTFNILRKHLNWPER